jgi:flavin reductase (DIM6/NTAB) family NADH-FMN oxidoreductase RutF
MSGEDIQQTFRLAMRRVASTVAIVSAQRGTERHGTTATSVTSISMDPPSVLVCFNQASRLHEFLTNQDLFCINLLHTENIDIAKRFSSNTTAAERFASGDWRADTAGTPYLANAQANLFCRKEKEINYGSHTIFIGRVMQALTREDISPLLYRDGRYGAVAPDTVPIND